MENKTIEELNALKEWEVREDKRKKETRMWIVSTVWGLLMVYALISLVERDWGNDFSRGAVAVFIAFSFLVLGIMLERKGHTGKYW